MSGGATRSAGDTAFVGPKGSNARPAGVGRVAPRGTAAAALSVLLPLLLLGTAEPSRAQSGPPPPENLRASAVDSAQIDLVWQPPDGLVGGPSSYNVYRDGARVGSTSDTTYSDTGLEPGTTYTYRVRSVNDLGNEGDPSAPATATTPDPEDTSPPTIPTDVQATARDSTRIALEWTASRDSETGVDHYRVYREGDPVGEPDTTFFRDDGLQPATTYSYRISAVNADGAESDRSGAATATTAEGRAEDDTPPAPPTDLRRVEG